MLQYIVLFPLRQHDIPTGFGSDPLMKTRKLFRYIHSFLTTSENENMDAQSLKRLRRISLVLLGLEAAAFFWFVLSGIGRDKPLHFLVPAIVALISGTVLYRNQVLASIGAVRMEEDNRALRDVSRHDALTGLLNRMALEADACRMLGRNLTVYMIDINYFKEVNDQYGHAAGDALLRETGEILKHLYPDGHYYRYGGDEFLVLTHRPAHENYGAETYDLRHSTCGVRMLLSIGSAQDTPMTYSDLFALISRADKALYTVKKRTHSAEYGGHERRSSDQQFKGKAENCA